MFDVVLTVGIQKSLLYCTIAVITCGRENCLLVTKLCFTSKLGSFAHSKSCSYVAV